MVCLRCSSSHVRAIVGIVVGMSVVLLPVLECRDVCFTGLVARVCLLAAVSILASGIVLSRESYVWRRGDCFFVLCCSWFLFRYFTSSVPCDLLVLFDLVSMILLYVCVRNTLPSDTFFYALFFAGMVQAAWGVLQAFRVLSSFHPYFDETGSFTNPALWALYLALSMFSGICLMRRYERPVCRVLIIAGICFVATGLVLARSRAAWGALAGGIVWLFLLPRCKSIFRRWKGWSVVWGVVVLGVSLLICRELYLIRPESVDGRMLIYRVSFSLFMTAPWFGSGISSFAALYMPQQAHWLQAHADSGFGLLAGNNHFAFNECFKIACEQGVVGVILFGLLVFYCLYHVTSEGVRRNAGWVVMIFIFGLFGYPFSNISISCVFCVALANVVGGTGVLRKVFRLPQWGRWGICLILAGGVWLVGSEYRFRRWVETNMAQGVFPGQRGAGLNRSPDFVLRLAEELYTRERYEEAIPVLEQACRLRCNELILNILGDCYRHVKEYDRAIEVFSLASQMTPAYILPRFHLFSLYREIGDEENARRVASEALDMRVKVVNTTVLRARHAMRNYLNQFKSQAYE